MISARFAPSGALPLAAAAASPPGSCRAGASGVAAAPAPEADAIRRILQQDARPAHMRNEATRDAPLPQAALDYAHALESLDYTGTPDGFKSAMLAHAAAWRAIGGALCPHTGLDTAHTEMHGAIDADQGGGPGARRRDRPPPRRGLVNMGGRRRGGGGLRRGHERPRRATQGER